MNGGNWMVYNIIHNRFKLREIEENDWKDIHNTVHCVPIPSMGP